MKKIGILVLLVLLTYVISCDPVKKPDDSNGGEVSTKVSTDHLYEALTYFWGVTDELIPNIVRYTKDTYGTNFEQVEFSFQDRYSYNAPEVENHVVVIKKDWNTYQVTFQGDLPGLDDVYEELLLAQVLFPYEIDVTYAGNYSAFSIDGTLKPYGSTAAAVAQKGMELKFNNLFAEASDKDFLQITSGTLHYTPADSSVTYEISPQQIAKAYKEVYIISNDGDMVHVGIEKTAECLAKHISELENQGETFDWSQSEITFTEKTSLYLYESDSYATAHVTYRIHDNGFEFIYEVPAFDPDVHDGWDLYFQGAHVTYTDITLEELVLDTKPYPEQFALNGFVDIAVHNADIVELAEFQDVVVSVSQAKVLSGAITTTDWMNNINSFDAVYTWPIGYFMPLAPL